MRLDRTSTDPEKFGDCSHRKVMDVMKDHDLTLSLRK
jgi:hypothetical protein